ncbi:tetratricopeptide repeat protein [Amycolatopsis sp. WGS_07]|uniref:tetratricopeptide repeat protein n=1 Tax=Amycolatopsis sp. WGS_07 TaxID=3076764 RepID=UPI0038730231
MAVDLGWNTGQTRIHAAGGRFLGAGVLIGGRYVLTSSRVVGGETAFDIDSAGPASLAGLVPPLADNRGDLALLELDTPAGPGATLRRLTGSAREVVLHWLLPGGTGVGAEATTGEPDGERVPLTLRDDPAGAEFSGCPAFARGTGRLLGIVVTGNGRWLVPAETVLAYFPQVRKWVTADSAMEDRLDELVALGLPAPDAGELRVALPKTAPPEPLDAVLTDAALPERHRFCARCGEEVGRGTTDRSGRVRGYCIHCGTPFAFLPRLEPGTLVAGRYSVAGCLAHGGYSWIYLARDEADDGRFVVLKGLIAERDRGGALAAAQAAVLPRLLELDHPNVVRTLAHVEHPDPDTGRLTGYLVMEYVRGISLRTVLRRAKRLRPEQVAAYGLQLLEAVGYLHERGLLYVDLKPDNVLQDGDRITLVDLGSVRREGDRDSVIVGTPGYQPDAELHERGLSVRSDLYSVGRTMAELLRACSGPRGSVGWEMLQALIDRATDDFAVRFRTADEMADQVRGVLRQLISQRTRVPRPAASRVFGDPRGLAPGGLGVPEWSAWDLEPPLRADEPPRHDDLARVLPSVLPAAHEEVAWQWGNAVSALERGTIDAADSAFRECARLVPGELTPLLALGFCAELLGMLAPAARYYEAVWVRDRNVVSAAFGLARTRLGPSDRVGAAAVLDDVPDTAAARAGAVRALAAIRPGDAGLPSLAEATVAWSRLGALDLDEDEQDRLTAVVGETIVRLAFEPSVAARLPDLREVRNQLIQIYGEHSERGWPVLRGHASRVRGAEALQQDSRPRVVVHHPGYLPPRTYRTTVTVAITAGSEGGETRLFLREAPGCVVYGVRQLAPVEVEMPLPARQIGDSVLGLGSWAPGETRRYALHLLVPSGMAREEENQLIAMWVKLGSVHSEAETVSVRLTDDATGSSGLADAIDAAYFAYREGDARAVTDALGSAVALAAAQGNEAVLARLRLLVDIVDAEHGLVSLRGPLAGKDLLPERISARPEEREKVPSEVLVPAEEDVEVLDSARYESAMRSSTIRVSVVRRGADSRIVDSRHVDSRTVDSRRADSRRADSRRADSRRADSRRADSRRADSRRADSLRADSRPTVRRTGRVGYPVPPDQLDPELEPLYSRKVLWPRARGARPPDEVPRPAPGLLEATVECDADGPAVVGQPVRVAVSVRRKEPSAAQSGVVRVRVLLDAAPGVAEPMSRIGWITGDRLRDPAEFAVVPRAPGPLRLAFRIYREHDAQLLLEIAAALPVEVPS